MTIQVDFWQLLLLGVTLAGAFFGFAKLLLANVQRHIESQFASLNGQMSAQQAAVARLEREYQAATGRLERELLELKAELPRDYVRREDYTQAIATIATKLDAMAMRFENILLGGSQHGR